MERPRFHLSIPSCDLEASRRWYVEGLGCTPGRSSADALILDLGGHQLVLQKQRKPEPIQSGIYPRHFGLVFDQLGSWEALRDRITGLGEPFRVEPKCRFSGEALEHWTFFLQDPSANWLEFKHYSNPEAVLACHQHTEVGDRDLR